MEPKTLKVAVSERESVTALLYLASKRGRLGVTIVLGHGAGANQLSGFMREFAHGIGDRRQIDGWPDSLASRRG